MPKPLPRSFYDREPAIVARELIGAVLIRVAADGRTAGRIVETEAYLADNDAASHSRRGLTRRNASMFGPPGHAYVYTIHTRFCLNAVTQPRGIGSAVLIRAIEPLDGIVLMRQRRGIDRPLLIARGPGRLCEALAIDRALDGLDLTHRGELWIAAAGTDVQPIIVGPRIGISNAREHPLRFCLRGSRFVSTPRPR